MPSQKNILDTYAAKIVLEIAINLSGPSYNTKLDDVKWKILLSDSDTFECFVEWSNV